MNRTHDGITITPGNTADVRYESFTRLDQVPQIGKLPKDMEFDMEVVSHVLPFKVNRYVADELIDWTDIPADPIFQLTFPQRGYHADELIEYPVVPG